MSDGNNSYFAQVGASNSASVVQYNPSRAITKSGYVYIYVSNETPNIYTYWDNLQVTHIHGPLLQEEGYYPFGLGMKAISSQAALKIQTNYKFNAGTNLESSLDVDYYETYYRNYDAQIGRFTGIDPMGELTFSLSTYNFSTNNPILFNDPFGNFYKAPTSGHSFSEMVNIAIDNEFGEGSSMDFGLSEGGQGGGGENDEDGTAEGTASMTDVDFHFTGNKARDVFAALLNSYNNSDVDGNWSFSFGQDAQGHIGYWEWYNGNSTNFSNTGLRDVIAGTRFVSLDNNLNAGQIATIDNTKQAWEHYINGNASSVNIGTNSVNALLNTLDFKLKFYKIQQGMTTALSGNFSVNMTLEKFYIGRTNVNYSIACNGNNCSVQFDLFANDGFWDVDFIDENLSKGNNYIPDGAGPNLERFGGKPYAFIPVQVFYNFPNPGYK